MADSIFTGSDRTDMKVGDIVSGTVTDVTEFGVFADANGEEFLLLLHELSWQKVGLPSRFASVGDTVRFRILHLNDDDGTPRRLGSPKQARPEDNPWRDPQRYVVGNRFTGTVIRVPEWGVLVQHPLGADVLLPGSDSIAVGDTIDAFITAVDVASQRIEGRFAT